MKSIILCLCVAASLAGVSSAQVGAGKGARPDFSGTWELDRAASDYGGLRSIWKNPSTLVITHRGPELRITRTLTGGDGRRETKELVYYTDGRGETNQMAIGAGRVESKTKWEDGKVVAYSHSRSPNRLGGAESDMTLKWRLSDDGRTLTHTILGSMRPSVGVSSVADTINTEVKLVYRRVG